MTTRQEWTIEEINRLEKYYVHKKSPSKEIYPLFPNRTPAAIENVLTRFGMRRVKCRRWSDHEIEFLEAQYSNLGSSAMAEALGRSRNTVCQMACRLGIKARKRWTPAEVELFNANVHEALEYLARLLPSKNASQIQSRRYYYRKHPQNKG